MKAKRSAISGTLLLSMLVVFLNGVAFGGRMSPRSFAAKQKAKKEAAEKEAKEAERKAERKAEEEARKRNSQNIKAATQAAVDTFRQLERYNEANRAAEALGFMRKLTVVQTLRDGVLCQNRTLRYRWSELNRAKILTDGSTGELFFLMCDTAEMYDGFLFYCFVKPDGFFEYVSALGTQRKVRKFRLATPEEIKAARDKLGPERAGMLRAKGKSLH
jgi:hypothetical protein